MNASTGRTRLLNRWSELWQRLPAEIVPAPDVLDCYSEVGRVYHGVAHLEDCLDKLDRVRTVADRPDEI